MPSCPICGADLPFDNFAPPCDHLIADWPDGSDGDDGILGESCRTKAALDRLPTMYAAFTRLLNVACGRTDDAVRPTEEEDQPYPAVSEGDRRTLRQLLVDASAGEPIWYESFEDSLSDTGWPSYADAAGIVTKALDECPGIEITDETIGSMASTGVTFVWSSDRRAGIASVDHRLARLTGEMETGILKLRKAGWSKPTDSSEA